MDADSSSVLTPELALVDPVAAERARRALPEIVLYEDTLARRAPERPYAVVEPLWAAAAAATVETRGRRLPALRPHLVGLVLVTVVLAGVAAYLQLRPGPGRAATSTPVVRQAEAASTTVPDVHTTTASVLATTATKTEPAARTIPDFVWVAAKGAAAYRVEFFRGGRVVFAVTTKRPRLHVAASALAAGSYRWRVWALARNGARIGPALVDASLNVG